HRRKSAWASGPGFCWAYSRARSRAWAVRPSFRAASMRRWRGAVAGALGTARAPGAERFPYHIRPLPRSHGRSTHLPTKRPPAPPPVPVPVAHPPPGLPERGRGGGLAQRLRRPLAPRPPARWGEVAASRFGLRPRAADHRAGVRYARVPAPVPPRRLAGPRAGDRRLEATGLPGPRRDDPGHDRRRP